MNVQPRGKFPPVVDLLPHGESMVALDEVIDASPGKATASMTLRATDPFADGEQVDASASLEYMAQAIAACLGLETLRQGDAVRVGMVVACRELTLMRPQLRVGERFVVRAECVQASEQTSLFRTSLEEPNGALVATATMTLVHGRRLPE